MSAHTPGPWVSGVLGTSEAETTIAYVRTEGSSPIEAVMGNPDIAMVTGEANARLIASSPEMLAALERWIAYDDLDEADFSNPGPMLLYAEAITATRAAISKAKPTP